MKKTKVHTGIIFLVFMLVALLMSCPHDSDDPDDNNNNNGGENPGEFPLPDLLGKVLILQAYGTGSNDDGGISHSFVELYNKSDETVNLTGYYLQYSTGGANWSVLNLSGKTIPPRSSFLILGRKMNNRIENQAGTEITGRLQLDEEDADMFWQDGSGLLQMNNNRYKIFLVKSDTPVTLINPFDYQGNGTGVKAPGYVDLLGTNDNDMERDIDAFETAFIKNIYPRNSPSSIKAPYYSSKGKSVRRIDLSDSDDNARDFESIEWRIRPNNSQNISDDDAERFSPRYTLYGEWDPVHPKNSTESNNAAISALLVAGQAANTGTPAGSYSTVASPGSVTISRLVAGSAAIEITLAPGATFRTAKASGSDAPQWSSSASPSYSFANGEFLYIEATSQNGRAVNVYKIAVTVSTVSSTATVSGSYTLSINSTIPQQRVTVEAYSSQTAASGDLVASANANMENGTWSLQVPLNQAVWFKLAVTDTTGFTFGRVVSASSQTYTANASGIALTLGPYAQPQLTAFTLINADANASGVKQNKTGSINQGNGEISFANTSFTTVNVNTIINFHSLAANFTLSADSKLYVENVEQFSGVTPNNYYQDVTFTVVAGDNTRKTYKVAGPAPNSYRVVGTRSWQTHGFGVMNITTTNTTLGLPVTLATHNTANPGVTKLNLVWNPTGTYTYISPEGKVISGGTEIKGRGNATLRVDTLKSYNLKLTTAAGFDYYDYKTDKFVTLPAHRRWALLAHPRDDTRIKGTLGWEMGRRVLTHMGWQPHADYVFFFLNGEYKGLYILSEVIKPEQGRLGITPVASTSNSNGGFVVEMDNTYWYWDETILGEGRTGFTFDAMYSFMTSHWNLVGDSGYHGVYRQGVVFGFKEPDTNLGWYYTDPPEGNGNLHPTNTANANNFPRRAIVLASRPIDSSTAYNRSTRPLGEWIVPNDPGTTNGMMGTRGMAPKMTSNETVGGVVGSRTLSGVYPNHTSSAFVRMSQFIQNAEDAIYAHDYGNNGTGGYHNYIDINSFIDWHIAQEMCSNWELFILNGQYMHYDPSIQKLKMGPIWDLDQAWRDNPTGQFGEHPGYVRKTPFWYKELLGWEITSASNNPNNGANRFDRVDPYYVNRLQARWNAVKGQFSVELNGFVDKQDARFARLINNEGVNYASGVSGNPGAKPVDITVTGDRGRLKTFISSMVSNLDSVFSGYSSLIQ